VLLNRAEDTYAEEEKPLPDEQAGFRKGRSPMEKTYLLREILYERTRLTKNEYIYMLCGYGICLSFHLA
jgi:hypothetical protein